VGGFWGAPSLLCAPVGGLWRCPGEAPSLLCAAPLARLALALSLPRKRERGGASRRLTARFARFLSRLRLTPRQPEPRHPPNFTAPPTVATPSQTAASPPSASGSPATWCEGRGGPLPALRPAGAGLWRCPGEAPSLLCAAPLSRLALALSLPRKRERGGTSRRLTARFARFLSRLHDASRQHKPPTPPIPPPAAQPPDPALTRGEAEQTAGRDVPPLSRLRGRDSAKAVRKDGAEQGGGLPRTAPKPSERTAQSREGAPRSPPHRQSPPPPLTP
jgi:hypothetical protein